MKYSGFRLFVKKNRAKVTKMLQKLDNDKKLCYNSVVTNP